MGEKTRKQFPHKIRTLNEMKSCIRNLTGHFAHEQKSPKYHNLITGMKVEIKERQKGGEGGMGERHCPPGISGC